MKTLDNIDSETTKKNVSDVSFFGDPDSFVLISKASSKSEGWMKSTKAMQIDGVGVVIQVTTQNVDNVSESLVFVEGVKIIEIDTENKKTRKIVKI